MDDSGGKGLLDDVKVQGCMWERVDRWSGGEKHQDEEIKLVFGWVIGLDADGGGETGCKPWGQDI